MAALVEVQKLTANFKVMIDIHYMYVVLWGDTWVNCCLIWVQDCIKAGRYDEAKKVLSQLKVS